MGYRCVINFLAPLKNRLIAWKIVQVKEFQKTLGSLVSFNTSEVKILDSLAYMGYKTNLGLGIGSNYPHRTKFVVGTLKVVNYDTFI